MTRAISSLLALALLLLAAPVGWCDEAPETTGDEAASTDEAAPPDEAAPTDEAAPPDEAAPADEAVPLEAAPLVPGKAFEGAKDWVRCLAFHPESGALFAGSADRCLRLWDVASGELAKEIRIPRRLGAVP